jgi:hypothetical protein
MRGGSRARRVGRLGRAAGEASLDGEGIEVQEEGARCAEVREAEARKVAAREAASRKADAWMLRAERRDDADSVEIVSVHCEQEQDATHTVPSSPERAYRAVRAGRWRYRARPLRGKPRRRTHAIRGRIQTAGEELLHPLRIERERIAGADALGAPHETSGEDALQEDGDVARSVSEPGAHDVKESREVRLGVLIEFDERRRTHACCEAERNEKRESARSRQADVEKEVVGRMTSARSPDRDSTRAPDRIRPRLGKRAPLALSPAASPKLSPLLPPTRCLRPPLSPSKRPPRPVSVPSDSWLYPVVPRFAHGCAHVGGWRPGSTPALFSAAARHRDLHERRVCTFFHARMHGLSPAPSFDPQVQLTACARDYAHVCDTTPLACYYDAGVMLYSSMKVRYPALLSFSAPETPALPVWPCLLSWLYRAYCRTHLLENPVGMLRDFIHRCSVDYRGRFCVSALISKS